jgi:hypothetical protein
MAQRLRGIAVGVPRHAVDPRGRRRAQRSIRSPQPFDRDVMQEGVPLRNAAASAK